MLYVLHCLKQIMLRLAAASGVWMASKPTFQGHR